MNHFDRQDERVLKELTRVAGTTPFPNLGMTRIEYHGRTQAELRETTKIQNITARISSLRKKGYVIKTSGTRHGLAVLYYCGRESCAEIREQEKSVWTDPVGRIGLQMKVRAAEII